MSSNSAQMIPTRVTLDEYRDNLRKLIAGLRKEGVVVVLMTEPCFGDKHGVNGAGEHPNKSLAAYMDACREVARETKTPLVDHFEHWSKANAAGTDVGTWTTDQCHPNAKGHEEIAKLLVPVLKKALKPEK